MRMPFSEFITSGDLKFIIAFVIFTSISTTHLVKKYKTKSDTKLVTHHNLRINNAAFWNLILSALSLLLGLMHSFYFIGKAGGIAPNLIFQGVSYALITPIFGISCYIICKLFSNIFNNSTKHS